MSFLQPITIPLSWQRRYLFLRGALYVFIFFITVVLALRVLFPIIEQGFDFRTPDSSRNSLIAPRSVEGVSRANGKIESNGTLRADTTVVGDFSLVATTVTLAQDSPQPETLALALRRSYQSFFYPVGEAISTSPYQEPTYRVDDVYYVLRNDVLYPFVSEKAFFSRVPQNYALAVPDTSLLEQYPISETWLGFRVGSLLGNATGVFIVVSETEVRPVGSAEIFLALGYDFADVITVNEEELGVYTKGRIVTLGAVHPDGTLLLDQDSNSYYLVDQGTKRPLLPGSYLDFLVKERGIRPILVSKSASEKTVSCTLVPRLFPGTLSCTTPIIDLAPGFGNDFQMEVTSEETDIDINTLTLSFETAKNTENMMTLLSQIKQRLLARFGGA